MKYLYKFLVDIALLLEIEWGAVGKSLRGERPLFANIHKWFVDTNRFKAQLFTSIMPEFQPLTL